MIKTILVATDASKHAQKAVALASSMAAKYNAKLVIVHSLLRDAPNDVLRKVVSRKDLTKDQRHLLDHYQIDAQMALAQAGGMDAGLGWMPAPVELLEPIGHQILDRAVAVAKKARARQVTKLILGGEPADSILAAAKKQKADLLVVGTRGYGDLKSLLLGSVSHKLAARAHCPVVTVK